MKKTTILISTILLFTGISFASAYQAKPDTKAKTEKKSDKKSDKKDVKKVPVRKTLPSKPATTDNKTTK